MRVLITGGAGYIGYSLVEHLEAVDNVSEIIVYDNLSRDNYNFFHCGKHLKKTKFIKGDILNRFDFEKHLQNIDIIYHLAAYVDFPFSHKENIRYEQINQWGTSILTGVIQETPSVTKVIYLSSVSVYGFQSVTKGDFTSNPENAYGISKDGGEKFINLLNKKCDVYVFRCANVFGYNPCIRLDAIINQFMFSAINFNQILVYGDGTQIRPFIEVNKLCEQLLKPLDEKHAPGTKNLLQFNASINEVRDVIAGELDNMETLYINRNQKFLSTIIENAPDQEMMKDIIKASLINYISESRLWKNE
jgi:UDP-glucose 4-epimerase